MKTKFFTFLIACCAISQVYGVGTDAITANPPKDGEEVYVLFIDYDNMHTINFND
jgi:hypothetical protein